MKIRMNYVSNSSSCSSVIEDSPLLASLTSADWDGMLKSLYKDYDEAMKEHRREIESEGIEDWAYPFCAFDLKTERAEAEKELAGILEYWNSNRCVMKNGRLVKIKSEIDFDINEDWVEYCRRMEDRLECELEEKYRGKFDYVSADLVVYQRRYINDIHMYVNGYDSTGHLTKIKVPRKYMNAMIAKWDSIGICTNLQVLQNEKARFAIHFDEDEYCMLDGVTEDQSCGWETEALSYERLCEVFAKWFVQHGKVPAGFTWKDLYDATLTYNMHEG